ADERFWTPAQMLAACEAHRRTAIEGKVSYKELRGEVVDGQVVLMGPKKNPAKLTHYAFGQLARNVGAPAEYLRRLPPTLVVQNLNHGLKAKGDAGETGMLLAHTNGNGLIA